MKKVLVSLIISLFAFVANNAMAIDNIQLKKHIETTNIDTNGYVWNVKVYTTGLTNTISKVELVNPHPKLNAYNERAIQIAQNKPYNQLKGAAYTLEQLRQNPNFLEQLRQNPNFLEQLRQNLLLASESIEKNMSSHESLNTEFSLPIAFKQGLQVNPVRMNRFKKDVEKLCSRFRYKYDGDININATIRLTMTGNGQVTSVYIDSNDLHPLYIESGIRKALKNHRIIYPYNSNGILVDKYSVTIPLDINCQSETNQ